MLSPRQNHSTVTVVFFILSLHWLLSGLVVHGDVLLPGHLSPDASSKRQSSINDTYAKNGAIFSHPLHLAFMLMKHKSRRHRDSGKGFISGHEPSTFRRNASRHLPPRATFLPPARKPGPVYAPSQPHGSSQPPKASSKHSPSSFPAHSLPPNHPGPAVSHGSTPAKPIKIPPVASSPEASLKGGEGCEQKRCPDPLTSTPIGSPCGCVLPIHLRLKLAVTPYAVFPLIDKLEIEVAAATYLKQSQVKIVGVDADNQNQERTIVNIYLVPLGERFDNTTAFLIYERLWQKKVTINADFFGTYQVVYIHYPGLPASPPVGPDDGAVGIGPSGATEQPIVAKVTNKNGRVSGRMIAVFVLSSVAALLVCFGAVLILLWKCKTYRYASPAGGASFTPSAMKRSGVRSLLSSSMGSSMSTSFVSSLSPCLLSVKTFSLAELERATDGFGCMKVLGEGGFGRVYRGTLDDKTEVAVKVLIKDNHHGDREFISEVEMLSRLHHRNLVKLIGICIERRRCLVYELISNGSVESHLHGADKQNSPLDWDARMKIALGAARGLAYLHEDSNPRVIHGDFKASNVLLEKDFTPKVSDFGLAREASDRGQHISTHVMGTFGYVAPEYAMTGHLLVKSDVYSYGVVMLELLSGRKPVDMSKPPGQENLVTWARPLLTSREGVEQLVDPLLAGKLNFDNMARVAAIASMCVHPEVSQRPFMGEVVQALKLIYNDVGEACEDGHSHREDSSGPECDYGNESTPEGSWWQKHAPGLSYGYDSSSFITTMEYSSDPLEGVERRRRTLTFMSNLVFDFRGSPSRWQNRSCPVIHSKPFSHRLRGSMSEHGFLAVGMGTHG